MYWNCFYLFGGRYIIYGFCFLIHYRSNSEDFFTLTNYDYYSLVAFVEHLAGMVATMKTRCQVLRLASLVEPFRKEIG